VTADPSEAYSAAERRHMWVWGTACVACFVLGMITMIVGNTALFILPMGLAFMCANIGGRPWRPRMKARRQRRLRARGLLREPSRSDE